MAEPFVIFVGAGCLNARSLSDAAETHFTRPFHWLDRVGSWSLGIISSFMSIRQAGTTTHPLNGGWAGFWEYETLRTLQLSALAVP